MPPDDDVRDASGGRVLDAIVIGVGVVGAATLIYALAAPRKQSTGLRA